MGRDITKLHPRLQTLAAKLKEECKKKGLIIEFSECLRTVAEQDELYAQGRTKPGNIVTNARGSDYGSHHIWGTAIDFYRNDGKGAYNDSDGFFTKVGKIGQSLGLEWGGSWISPIDKPHFQLPDWGSTTSKLKSLYGTPEKFKTTWNVITSKPKYLKDEFSKDIRKAFGLKATAEKTELLKKVVTISKKENPKHAAVKYIQHRMDAKGYPCGSYDGIYGDKTSASIKKFQKEKGIPQTGIVDLTTWKKLVY